MYTIETTFTNEYELAEHMIMLYNLLSENDEYCSVSCIAHYEYIRDLTTALIAGSKGQISIVNAELSEPELKDYNDEFILSLDSYGLWIETEKKDEVYYDVEDEIIFIHNDCNSAILKKCSKDSGIVTFDFQDEEFNCSCDCDFCLEELDEDNESDSDGFSFTFSDENGTSSYSFYSSNKELVERTRRELINKLDI